MSYSPNRPPTLSDAITWAANGIGYARHNGRRPRLHPNGFIQIDLAKDGSERLHVWPAVPIPAQKTRHPIHDHSFDMESTVLCGNLCNVLYRALPLSDFEKELAQFTPYRMYRATRISKDDTVLAPADETFYAVVESMHENLEPGDTYYMQKGLLHDSVPRGLTATLMRKLDLSYEYRPIVAVPADIKPDNDFRRESVDEAELWRQIFIALETAQAVACQQLPEAA